MADRKTREKHKDRRTEILEHFQQVLIEEGFEGASMAKIAKRLNANPSLLLHYFPTKDEMTIELVEFILDKYETLGMQRIQSIDRPEQRLDTLLDIVFGIDWISLLDSSVFYACYYLSFRKETVRKRMEKMYQRFREQILIEVRACMAEGVLKKDDPEVITDFVISLVEGLAFTRNVSGGESYYIDRGKRFKQMVKQMLKKQESTVTISSRQELVTFKRQALKEMKQIQNRISGLNEKITDL